MLGSFFTCIFVLYDFLFTFFVKKISCHINETSEKKTVFNLIFFDLGNKKTKNTITLYIYDISFLSFFLLKAVFIL